MAGIRPAGPLVEAELEELLWGSGSIWVLGSEKERCPLQHSGTGRLHCPPCLWQTGAKCWAHKMLSRDRLSE